MKWADKNQMQEADEELLGAGEHAVESAEYVNQPDFVLVSILIYVLFAVIGCVQIFLHA